LTYLIKGVFGYAVINDVRYEIIGCPPFEKMFSLSCFVSSKKDSAILFLCKYKAKKKMITGHLLHWDNSFSSPIYKFDAYR
jgi:hypothetical protein